MKQKKKWIAIIVAIICLYGVGFAAEELVNIAVNYDTVKKIVVNHEEKTLPDGEKPFEYNGRTYVPLRFISEALGKHVSWNNSNGTVNINDIPKSTLLFEDDLSEDNDIWDGEMSVGNFYNDDGALYIGLRKNLMSRKSFCMLKKDYYPSDIKNFTVQVDMKALENTLYKQDMSSGGVVIGYKKISETKGITGYTGASVWIHTKEPIEELTVKRIENPSYMAGDYIHIPFNKYYTIKTVVQQTEDDTIIDTYVDDVLLRTEHLGMTIQQLMEKKDTQFGIGLAADYYGYYFKNFKLYSND